MVYSELMNFKYTCIALVNFVFFTGFIARASDVGECIEKLKATWALAGKAPNFFVLTQGQLAVEYGGQLTVFTDNGSNRVNGLSCMTGHEEKMSEGLALALGSMAQELSTGLSKEAPRKYVYSNKDIERSVQIAAQVCGRISSVKMTDELSHIIHSAAGNASAGTDTKGAP